MGFFFPVRGSSGGGGGGGSAVSTVTVSTGDVDPTDATNVDIAISSSRCAILSLLITRTAGTATATSIQCFLDDDRTVKWDGAASFGYVFGGEFDSVTVNPGPVQGPLIKLPGGGLLGIPIHYLNVDDSNFVRLVLYNNDGVGNGTWDVSLDYIALGGA